MLRTNMRCSGLKRIINSSILNYRHPQNHSRWTALGPGWGQWWCLKRNSSGSSQHVSVSRPERYFITTPIFYVNSAPHIGHLYTAVIADAAARWQRICGRQTIFSTGTDEHGLKIQQAANKAKKSPQVFCDHVSNQFKDLFDASDIQYSDFIRTTEARHKSAVTHFWRHLVDCGHIYKGSYEGWYSISDEAFLTQDQVIDSQDQHGNMVKVSGESGQPVEWMKEENYMFRLSKFGPKLMDWINQKGKDVIYPVNFQPLVKQWVEELPDLSVSRQTSRLQWGIPVPDDHTQTIYVWLDALVNYLTVGGYPEKEFNWPATHVIGKDILKFHAVYWPAFLMAAGISPPSQIICHSHWTIDNLKMSKSRGNVVDPVESIKTYTSDGLRYFLLREGVPHSDGNFSERRVVECLNSEVVNTLGNLLNRCTAESLNPSQVAPPFDIELLKERAASDDLKMMDNLYILPGVVDKHYREFNIYQGLDAIMAQLRETNGFIERNKPWEIKNDPQQQEWLACILGVVMETLRVSGILLQPVIPKISDKLLTRLGLLPTERDFHYSQRPDLRTRRLKTKMGVLYSRIK